jgi:diguanylate cyclase (GGDEF)-like protein
MCARAGGLMDSFAEMRPEKRAGMVFSVLVVIAITVATVSIQGVRTLQHFSERVIHVDGPAFAAARGVEARILAAHLFLHRAYLATNVPERRTNYRAYAREVAMAMAELEMIDAGQGPNSQTSTLIRDFVAAQQDWSASARDLLLELEQEAPAHVVIGHWQTLETAFTFVRARAQRIAISGIQPVVLEHERQIGAVGTRAVTTIALTLFVGVTLGILIIFASIRLIRAQRLSQEAENGHRDFSRRMQRAFQLVESEPDVLELAADVIDHAVGGDVKAELMLSKSGQKEIKRLASGATDDDWKGCPVPAMENCPTVQSNSRMLFPSNSAFEACRYLKQHNGGACSAACVPLSVMGRTVGVIHVVGPENELPDDDEMRRLESLARRAGDRIGLARALMSKDEAANTDMLTGLSNRRALEVALPGIIQEHGSYAVCYGDLDHFKRLNDDHGHDTGDRALRLFAQVLRNSLRPSELICRWGGEEFVIVFPGASAQGAVPALERVRARLRDIVKVSPVPEFTTSFGVSDSTMAETFEEVLHRADAALMSAKKAGRDCYIVDNAEHDVLEDDAVDSQLSAQSSTKSA